MDPEKINIFYFSMLIEKSENIYFFKANVVSREWNGN